MNKFSVRDDIERAIKELGVDRATLFEVSKFQWKEILYKVIEQFIPKIHYTHGLHWGWNRLKEPQVTVHFRNDDGYKYIADLVDEEYV